MERYAGGEEIQRHMRHIQGIGGTEGKKNMHIPSKAACKLLFSAWLLLLVLPAPGPWMLPEPGPDAPVGGLVRLIHTKHCTNSRNATQ